ncbi:EamA family transporter, partial [Leucobacter sp. M11]|uniref:EamA family transporter n=1 Tax=Leucobacter sp. M11 TaxID=2993565 RepID=UPI002D803FAC
TLPRGIWWWRSLLLGALNIGAFFPLLFLSAYRLPGGVAATLGAVQPLVVALIAVPLLRDRLSTRKILWGLVGVAGVSLVALRSSAQLDALGIAAGIAGPLGMAVGTVLTKRWGRPAGVGPTAFAGWQLTAGGLILLPVTLLAEGVPASIDGPAALGYLWLTLAGGLLSYAIWFDGIGKIPVTSAALLGLVSPLVAAALGALVLGQWLGPWQLAGFALALAAIVGGQLPGRTKAQPGSPGPAGSRAPQRTIA